MAMFGGFHSRTVVIPALAHQTVMGEITSGSSNRDGVQYQWAFKDGQVVAGVWVTERTWSGYHYNTRVL